MMDGPNHGQRCVTEAPRNSVEAAQHREGSISQHRPAEDIMAYFKVLPCPRKHNHDWQYCFYKHRNDRAARRSLQTHKYAAVLCPDMLSKGHCQQGDACSMAHSVFEYWLHPDKFRTKLCTDGEECRRSMCFFAHSPQELRTPSSARLGHPQPPPPPPPPHTAPGSSSNSSSSSDIMSLATAMPGLEVLSTPSMDSSSSYAAGQRDQDSRHSSRQLQAQTVSAYSPHAAGLPNRSPCVLTPAASNSSSSSTQMLVYFSPGSAAGAAAAALPATAAAYQSGLAVNGSSGIVPNPGIVVGTASSGGEAAGAGLHHSFQQQQQQQQQVFIPAAGMNDRTAAQLQRLQQLRATADAVAGELVRLRLECSRSMQEAGLANAEAEAASRDLEALVAAAAVQQGMSPPNYGAAACSSAAGSGSNYVIMQHSPMATSMASSSCSMSPVAPVSRLLQLGSQAPAGMSLLLPEQELSVRAAGVSSYGSRPSSTHACADSAAGAAAAAATVGCSGAEAGVSSMTVMLQQPVMMTAEQQQQLLGMRSEPTPALPCVEALELELAREMSLEGMLPLWTQHSQQCQHHQWPDNTAA